MSHASREALRLVVQELRSQRSLLTGLCEAVENGTQELARAASQLREASEQHEQCVGRIEAAVERIEEDGVVSERYERRLSELEQKLSGLRCLAAVG